MRRRFRKLLFAVALATLALVGSLMILDRYFLWVGVQLFPTEHTSVVVSSRNGWFWFSFTRFTTIKVQTGYSLDYLYCVPRDETWQYDRPRTLFSHFSSPAGRGGFGVKISRPPGHARDYDPDQQWQLCDTSLSTIFLCVAHWGIGAVAATVAMVSGLWIAVPMWRDRQARRSGAVLCTACGYDLRGTVAAERSACPECGAPITIRSDV